MTNTRTFTVSELNEMNIGPWRPHSVETIEEHRWYILKAITFEHEGHYWQVDYMDPATEMQDGQEVWPNGDDADAEVAATQVEQVAVTVMKWQPVKDLEDVVIEETT